MVDEIVPPAAVTEPQAKVVEAGEPSWLPARIEQAKRSAQSELLKELGVTDSADLKAKLETLRKSEEERKSELQRLQDRVASLEPTAGEVEKLRGSVRSFAAAAMSSLNEQQRSAVTRLAGDDASKQLEVIDTLKTSGFLADPEPVKAQVKPANTSAAAPAPSAADTTQTDHKSVYEKLMAENPLTGRVYLLKHARDIYR